VGGFEFIKLIKRPQIYGMMDASPSFKIAHYQSYSPLPKMQVFAKSPSLRRQFRIADLDLQLRRPNPASGVPSTSETASERRVAAPDV
jgi:hypothetical protein